MPTTYGEMAVGDALVVISTPYDAVTACVGTARIGLRAEGVRTVDVLAPFRHVAGHVVESQFVRLLTAYGMFPIAGKGICPTDAIRYIASGKTVVFAL